MTDDLPARIIRIQKHADAGAQSDWLIADEAAEVVGKRDGDTHRIAISLRPARSDDWVERRGHAGQLYRDLAVYAAADSAHLRERLDYTFFDEMWKVRRRCKIGLSDVLEFLKEVDEEPINIEAFRDKMSELFKANDEEPELLKVAKRLVKSLPKDFINAPALDVDATKYKKARAAGQMFVDALNDLLAA